MLNMLGRILLSVSVVLGSVHGYEHELGSAADQCTTMAISSAAMEDGSAIASKGVNIFHNLL